MSTTYRPADEPCAAGTLGCRGISLGNDWDGKGQYCTTCEQYLQPAAPADTSGAGDVGAQLARIRYEYGEGGTAELVRRWNAYPELVAQLATYSDVHPDPETRARLAREELQTRQEYSRAVAYSDELRAALEGVITEVERELGNVPDGLNMKAVSVRVELPPAVWLNARAALARARGVK